MRTTILEADYVDQVGRDVRVPHPPRRVVSLCPSITDTLFALGLQGRIVGRTRFCVRPRDRVGAVPSVGGPKAPSAHIIDRLRPDVVFAVKEENPRAVVEDLAQRHPVFVLDVTSFGGALETIRELGRVVAEEATASRLRRDIEDAFRALPKLPALRTLYLVWYKPYMAAGAHTFIDSMLQVSGLRNTAAVSKGRYPRLTEEAIVACDPELILLATEPFAFTDTHAEELRALVPNARVARIPGEIFSWYGAHLLEAADALRKLEGSELFTPS